MLREDNSGFVHFPIPGKVFNRLETGKTFVYLVAFDSEDVSNKAYELSNLRLISPGTFIADDISMRARPKTSGKMSIDELIKNKLKDDEYDNLYFPNSGDKDDLKKLMSIPLTTCICMGWSDYTFDVKDDLGFWNASFRDLTNEGRKLYYSIKKLHNNKEVRILTFSNI
jgi:hypothetical protein